MRAPQADFTESPEQASAIVFYSDILFDRRPRGQQQRDQGLHSFCVEESENSVGDIQHSQLGPCFKVKPLKRRESMGTCYTAQRISIGRAISPNPEGIPPLIRVVTPSDHPSKVVSESKCYELLDIEISTGEIMKLNPNTIVKNTQSLNRQPPLQSSIILNKPQPSTPLIRS